MYDIREKRLAEVLVHHSVGVKDGDKVLIETFDIPDGLIEILIDTVAEAGGLPFVSAKRSRIQRQLLRYASESQMGFIGEFERMRMKGMDCYIGIRGSHNISELSDIPAEKMDFYEKYWLKPAHFEERVRNTRWVVLRYPNASMAQLAGMSTTAFEDFYFQVCTLDYGRMSEAMEPLVSLMEKTDEVHIIAPGTDIRFSIAGMKAIKCAGESNIPDGEVFTAPVRESVNGVIQYNAESLYHGTVFSNVELHFKNGRIEKAVGNAQEKLDKIFNTDEGARYVGEFAIGVNPYITKPMKDILFDEKIAGSIHFTPGNAYDEADNGNRSAIHWDLVLIQTPEYGGGTIKFDGKTIRQDGRFTLPELEALNPEKLMGKK
jgi:aminopeptidase